MTAKAPLESRVTKKILEYLRSRGAYAQKIHGSPLVTRGQLDVSTCYKGRYIALEVKRDSAGKPTVLQLFHQKQIRAAGGIAEIVWSVAQVKVILDKLDET